MSTIHTAIKETCRGPVIELPRPITERLHFIVEDGGDLVNLCMWARQQDYYLCTMVASDERFLEDHVFKIYYVLSASEEELVVLEHPLADPRHPTQYASIRAAFPSVEPLERESFDLFGLSPLDSDVEPGFVLHARYPPEFYPLRPSRSLEKLRERIKRERSRDDGGSPSPSAIAHPPEGMLVLPVGPIHAGVIEAGHFRFHIAGEVVEDLEIRLGYKHKGIEKLFETEYTLEEGWRLAEKVSGDTSFAHSLAYCEAVEALAGVRLPKLPKQASYWRGLLLELERLYNHIGDVAAIVHDMAFDLLASEIAVLREQVVRLNQRLTGHRLLRGVNRPGGVVLHRTPDLEDIRAHLAGITDRFLSLSSLVLDMPACRDRSILTGVLTESEAKMCGATGLAARASGLWEQDFRLKHPRGVYSMLELRHEICATVVPDNNVSLANTRRVPVFLKDLRGDVFARLALRVAEVETSARIIGRLAKELDEFDLDEPTLMEPLELTKALRATPNFEFGLGYAEGWRGDIVYWVMKGPNNTILRCKVRDPSLFNWPALRLAVVRKQKLDRQGYWENILADFPLINKSFNLSYSGHDL